MSLRCDSHYVVAVPRHDDLDFAVNIVVAARVDFLVDGVAQLIARRTSVGVASPIVRDLVLRSLLSETVSLLMVNKTKAWLVA